MQPHKASRRHLLGGLLAALFGWLLPRKAPAQPTQPEPASTDAGHIEVKPYTGTVTYCTYDANGDCIASSPPLVYQGTVVSTYHPDSKQTSISYSGPPPAQEPSNG